MDSYGKNTSRKSCGPKSLKPKVHTQTCPSAPQIQPANIYIYIYNIYIYTYTYILTYIYIYKQPPPRKTLAGWMLQHDQGLAAWPSSPGWSLHSEESVPWSPGWTVLGRAWEWANQGRERGPTSACAPRLEFQQGTGNHHANQDMDTSWLNHSRTRIYLQATDDTDAMHFQSLYLCQCF